MSFAYPMSSAPVTFGPVVSPPRTPLLNGANAFTSTIGTSTSPTLSWTAPSLAPTGTFYEVSVFELTNNAGTTRATLAAKFDVKIATATDVYLRGPNCPPSSTCPPTPTVNMERIYQQPIGDLIADALLATYKPLGAKIGITNGGGIRASLPSTYKPALFGKVTTGGTTPPTLTLSGTPANGTGVIAIG